MLTKSGLLACMVGVLAVSCSPGRRAAIELDKVARSVDRYGFASISTPFMADTIEELDFDLDKTAAEYFELASKPQGAVRHYDAEALTMQVAIRANVEAGLKSILKFKKEMAPKKFEAAQKTAGFQKLALKSLVGSNPALDGNPAIKMLMDYLGVAEGAHAVVENSEGDDEEGETNKNDEPIGDDAPVGDDEPDKDGETAAEKPAPKTPELPKIGPPFTDDQLSALKAVVATFTEGLKLPEDDPQISAREAMVIADGDVVTEALFKWFKHPTRNKLDRYELFICPMVVSVQPGYQTRDGYLADITVNVDLAQRKPGCQCKCREGGSCDECLTFLSDRFCDSSPPILVTGVFPVIDAQVLNLVNSRRKLYSMAMQLSVAGFASQGDFFANYAKKLERDAKTQTALTAASAYTLGDTAFGFRVEPKFVASKNPAQFQTEPGRILESRAFPALATVLVDRKYLRPTNQKVKKLCKPNEYYCDSSAGDDQCSDCYDYLVFETSTRWSPMSETKRVWGGVLSVGGRVSEVEVWRRAQSLDRADKHVGQIMLGDEQEHQRLHLQTRTTNLGKLGLDSRAIVRVFSSFCRGCMKDCCNETDCRKKKDCCEKEDCCTKEDCCKKKNCCK